MQKIISLFYKALRKIIVNIRISFDLLLCFILMYLNNVNVGRFKSNGIPYISVSKDGVFKIGKNFKMINGLNGNPIGRPQRCVFFVDKDAELIIGNNVGISSTAIVAHKSIIIGDNVKIGAGVCIYDTDFHSLNAKIRINSNSDMISKIKSPVLINNNAFIGAHSTILKGVNIGENSVIGACSVVTKNVPDNEIWAGNPARFIRNI